MNEYTVSIEDGMRVKHDAMARLTVKTRNEVLEDRLVKSTALEGAFTVACIMYNRASVSGGVDWYNPATGLSILRPKMMVRFREQDILTGDELCNCEECRERREK